MSKAGALGSAIGSHKSGNHYGVNWLILGFIGYCIVVLVCIIVQDESRKAARLKHQADQTQN